ncbi:MAG TPA: chalcone isomerase family protein [Azospirillaceae bacterium]|nr:chalcone isomerase family protein [Azospirillaceae bacterium]
MRLKIIVFLSVLFGFSQTVFATDVVKSSVPGASIVGRGILTYLVWDVYEATLYAPNGRWESQKPFALSIEYYRALQGADIAKRSVQEMRRQGFTDEAKLADWYTRMKAIFPNVAAGTVLTAVFTPVGETAFYNGNTPVGVIQGGDFARLFFGIWLDEKTSEPELRRALLGLS